MVDVILANASPEKRLFISLLTRDISLIAAFLDLVDNSINAVVEPYADRLTSAQNYRAILADESIRPSAKICLTVAAEAVEVVDTASGISAETAAQHVFKFGRSSGQARQADRLSVYGIGLKRAMFKLGNKIRMRSDHVDGGFDLELDVESWAKTDQQVWTFPISPRAPVEPMACGTTITVTELHDDVRRRIGDGVFEGELRDAISRTYAYFMAKFVTIELNKREAIPVDIEIGKNNTSDSIEIDGVTCDITAGLGISQTGRFRDVSSGWFVFCNGRAVVSADKTPLTGWGGLGVPIFQPKHRPFLGTVFFVSANPELLPWNTTKSGINEDSALWQLTKRQMSVASRVIISFLDSRYGNEGTEIATKDIQDAAGQRVSVLSSGAAGKRTFSLPKKPRAKKIRIQYDAQLDDIKRIADYLKNPSMSGSEIGRHTFDYFLRNEVGEK